MKTAAEKICTARLFEAIVVNGRKLDLKTITGIQKECYSVLESKYTETLNELCESRKKQIEQSATNKELSLLTRKQELDIQELKRRVPPIKSCLY